MLRQKSFSVATTTVFASLLVASLCQVANANPIIGELFYTRFAGTEQVKKVDFAYDGATSFTLGTKTTLATGIGADGITGNPNDPNSLFIDGQGGSLHRVSRDGPSTNGAGTNGVISSTSVPNAAFHLEVPNSTTLYSSGIPGGAFNSTVINPDGSLGTTTSVSIGGDDAVLTQIITTPHGDYYTTASPGGPGKVGSISIAGASSTTTRLNTGISSAHGGVYDPLTDTFLTFGTPPRRARCWSPLTCCPLAYLWTWIRVRLTAPDISLPQATAATCSLWIMPPPDLSRRAPLPPQSSSIQTSTMWLPWWAWAQRLRCLSPVC
jgi:hypothetical protein